METERFSPRYADIDLWEPDDILDAMIEAQFSAVAAVRAARPAVAEAGLAMAERLREKGRIVYVGAGTSGRLAAQDGAELMPTFGWPRERLLLLIAGGPEALFKAVEGAEDEVRQAEELVEQHGIGAEDAMIGVAASGTTPFTLSCQRAARARGALAIGIANNPDTPLLKVSDHPILLGTGAEPIAGSTRMTAATAQRIVLNLLSSLMMIRLGRVYRGLMIDVRATNRKLVRRAEAMLRHLTGRGPDDVRAALAATEGNVKLAVLVLHGCDVDKARRILNDAQGRLRDALAMIGVTEP